MVTNKQKHAVRFIVETMRIPFKGDINDIKDVSRFLDEYFDDAKLLNSQLEEIANYHDDCAAREDIMYDYWLSQNGF